MTIKPGDTLPSATFTVMTEDGPAQTTTEEYFKGRKVALFAVPGAFTPTCHNNHLPSFLNRLEDLKAKADKVACVSVNDVFVLNAWADHSGAKGKIDFLADGNGDFAKATGLFFDATARGLGIRSQRYAMLVDDGVVKTLLIEDQPGVAVKSNADELLAAL